MPQPDGPVYLVRSPRTQWHAKSLPLINHKPTALAYAVLMGLSGFLANAQAQNVINVPAGMTHSIPGNYSPGAFNGGTIATTGRLNNNGLLNNDNATLGLLTPRPMTVF